MPAFDEREEEDIDTDTDTDINISDEDDIHDGTGEAKGYLRICAKKRVVPVQVRMVAAVLFNPPGPTHRLELCACSSVPAAGVRHCCRPSTALPSGPW